MQAIQESKVKSPVLDDISSIFLKHLSDNRFEDLLEITNQSFLTSYVPKSWKIGMILSILKPGKPKSKIILPAGCLALLRGKGSRMCGIKKITICYK